MLEGNGIKKGGEISNLLVQIAWLLHPSKPNSVSQSWRSGHPPVWSRMIAPISSEPRSCDCCTTPQRADGFGPR
jgi:hypothetical protein